MLDAAVLFARSDSIYKKIPCLDVFDITRDARNFNSDLPVIAHPPCRAWGRLRHFSNPRPDEKELAFFAVEKVQKNGGVLEHPEFSTLWKAANLPLPGVIDNFGGFTFPLPQFWFGHKARKNTWLYIVGIEVKNLPVFPLVLGNAEYVIRSFKGSNKPLVSKAEREHTPENFALWLVELARMVKNGRH